MNVKNVQYFMEFNIAMTFGNLNNLDN